MARIGSNRNYKNFSYELADCLQEVDLLGELWQAINLLRAVITGDAVYSADCHSGLM